MSNLHFKFSGLSLGFILCIQSSTSKSRQNRFATKITGVSVLNNLIDQKMFSKQVVHRRGKLMTYSRCIKGGTMKIGDSTRRTGMFTIVQNDFDLVLGFAKL